MDQVPFNPSVVTITGGTIVGAVISGSTIAVADNAFTIYGNGDATKTFVHQVDTQGAGFTLTVDVGAQTASRTFTFPVVTGNNTLAVLETAQVFTAGQTILTAGTTLTCAVSDTATATQPDGILLTHRSSNTPAAAFGVCFRMSAESTTTDDRGQFLIQSEWVVATDASRTSRAGLYTFDTAARECIRMQASGSAAMIGFLGASAVVRPTSTTDLRTALINLGLYTSGGATPLNLNGGAFTALTAAVTGTTNATSISTGTIVCSGGAAIAANLISGQGIGWGVTSTPTATGTTTLTATSTVVQTFTGTAPQTVQFPAANLFGSGIAVVFVINNQASATVTPTRAGSDTFQGGGTTDPVLAGASQTYMSNGVSVWLKV